MFKLNVSLTWQIRDQQISYRSIRCTVVSQLCQSKSSLHWLVLHSTLLHCWLIFPRTEVFYVHWMPFVVVVCYCATSSWYVYSWCLVLGYASDKGLWWPVVRMATASEDKSLLHSQQVVVIQMVGHPHRGLNTVCPVTWLMWHIGICTWWCGCSQSDLCSSSVHLCYLE